MNTFLFDIWTDLREKRLWPVAAGLLVGLIAVPFILAKPAEEAQPAPVATSADTDPVTAQLLPADLEAAKPLLRTSTLSEFESKDPFKPLRALEQMEDIAGVASPLGGDLAAPDDGAALGGETGGDTGGGFGGDTGGGDPGTTPPPVDEEKTVFTYQAVVQLGTPNGTRRRVVNRLGILPNASNPMLVFLGVTASDPDEAVFLVDSTVSQAGEGRCKPSVGVCSFLYLKTSDDQNEHIFTTDDGREYTIELVNVRRVKVQSVVSSASSAAEGDRPTASTALGATDELRPVGDGLAGFGFPLFADEEE
jgi:hypothetical protein